MKISAFSVELKVEMPVENSIGWLYIVTGEAEPQEGGGIAQAWIIDLKVYISQYINAPMMVFVPEGKVVATGGRFVTFLFFVDNACQALMAD